MKVLVLSLFLLIAGPLARCADQVVAVSETVSLRIAVPEHWSLFGPYRLHANDDAIGFDLCPPEETNGSVEIHCYVYFRGPVIERSLDTDQKEIVGDSAASDGQKALTPIVLAAGRGFYVTRPLGKAELAGSSAPKTETLLLLAADRKIKLFCKLWNRTGDDALLKQFVKAVESVSVENAEEKRPNQALLPTSTAVTPAASAPVAPTAAAADL